MDASIGPNATSCGTGYQRASWTLLPCRARYVLRKVAPRLAACPERQVRIPLVAHSTAVRVPSAKSMAGVLLGRRESRSGQSDVRRWFRDFRDGRTKAFGRHCSVNRQDVARDLRLIPLRAADRLELLGDLLREPGDVPAEREDDHAHIHQRLQGRPVLGLPLEQGVSSVQQSDDAAFSVQGGPLLSPLDRHARRRTQVEILKGFTDRLIVEPLILSRVGTERDQLILKWHR